MNAGNEVKKKELNIVFGIYYNSITQAIFYSLNKETYGPK